MVEVPQMRASYWQAIGLALPVEETKEDAIVYQTKEDKDVRKRKTK